MINPEALSPLIPDINQQLRGRTDEPAPFTPPTTGVPAPMQPAFGATNLAPMADPATGMPPTTGVPAPPQVGTEQPFEFPFPEQWQTATDVYNRFAETGMPTDVSGMGGALWDVYRPEAQRAAEQQLERAGLMGTRFGTPVGRRVGEEFARAGERTTLGALPFEYAAQEAGRGRQMGAAGGLTGLGGQYLYAPMNIAQSMAGMGGQAQAAQMAELGPIYQEFLRTTPEASPWLQYALGSFGGEVPYGPQLYEPGTSSQLMDMSSLFAMMQMLQGGGGGGTSTGMPPSQYETISPW